MHNTTDDRMRIVEHEHLTYEIKEIIKERVKNSPPRSPRQRESKKNIAVHNVKLEKLNTQQWNEISPIKEGSLDDLALLTPENDSV